MVKETRSILTYPSSLCLATLVIAITSAILFTAETQIAQSVSSFTLAMLSFLPGALFIILALLEIYVINRKRNQKSPLLISYYMLFKGIRLLLTMGIILGYSIGNGSNPVVFAINVLVLFLTTLCVTTIINVKAEQIKNQSNETE